MIYDSSPLIGERRSFNLEQLYNNLFIKTKKYIIFAILLVLLLDMKGDYINFKILKNITDKENYITKNRVKLKGRKFLDKCLRGELINKTFEISNYPKITIIIPIYNTGELIKSVVRSIQNQHMQDLEIILANDFSNDNGLTLNIREKLREEDSRILE